ncbi:putative protein farnesyltransferase alpha subunit [Leptomonas seymouri]|uniref:Protein farnesyltransferase/geranylgeranyltransferase type-1 subunit alpha n=1 Tax=Leptomonas seymouri TaxID=5684 RepID=A0A0N1IKH9_LEPSE|nr:putative protein farnesyltransferase alpha subunit [Leptomonas seymouri]|eukprot:KPI86271.1 putative protein farnesyltransferase alpha subunit [Leptomonas seymouri]
MSAPSSDRSASAASSSSSSAHSLSSIDGEHLYQLACVETFLPLSKDVTLEEEPTACAHPVARIDYSPNFKLIYGLYRALRSKIEYVDSVAQHRRGDHSLQIIRALNSSPARWLLLLGFALRQCTSNYTVWKDRRDVIMSAGVLRQATRDQLPALALPDILLSLDPADAAKKEEALAKVKEAEEKVELVAQHWLPGASDLFWGGDATPVAAVVTAALPSASLSPWRAVRWELNAVGCFTRFYHKNFQVWHHRRELLSYALQQTTLASPPAVHISTDGGSLAAATSNESVQPSLESEEKFSAYLKQNHGICFADVDERETVKAVLCNEDSKNYHAWLHLTWYLHSLPFLLQTPSWPALKAFARALSESQLSAEQQPWMFCAHPQWAFASSAESDSSLPASRRPTLPPSGLTTEIDFTALLIHQDCLNNSAWCHRYSLFKDDLLRGLWREQLQPRLECSGGEAPVSDPEFIEVVYALCMVEVDFALQWLYVDPTNESAHTHARCIATLFHTIVVMLAVLRDVTKAGETVHDRPQSSVRAMELLHYLRDAPLSAPVAAANLDLYAKAEDGSVSSSSPARDAVLRRMQHPQLSWSDYHHSFAILRYIQRVLHASIQQRVRELETQAARVLRAGANVASSSPAPANGTPQKVTLLNTLFERSSQYMLDNFHQVNTAQYLLYQVVLEEMWVLYLSAAQRRAVWQSRPPEAYREGIKPEWTSCQLWEGADVLSDEDNGGDVAVACFLRYEAAALDLAKRLSVQDPIRYKYWKFEAMSTMQRSYGATL